MASVSSSTAKPDWMFRLGCGLWVILAFIAAWVIFDALGWRIYPHEVYWFLAYLAYSVIAYQFDGMKQQNRHLVEELEETKDRLLAVERLLTNYPLIGAPSLHSQRDRP